MGNVKTLVCLFTGQPAENFPDNFAGFSYRVEIDGYDRTIRLQYDDYESSGWFKYNRRRILKKIAENDHWDLLEQGLSFADLQDYVAAPARFYSATV